MIKKYKVVVALCTIGLFGGMATQTVDASASVGSDNIGQQSEEQTKNHQINDVTHTNDLQTFFKKCFPNWNISWDQSDVEVEKPNTPEVNEPSTPEELPDDSVVNQPTPPQPEQGAEVVPETKPDESPVKNELNAFEQQVVELTNQERAKHGLAALKVDVPLSKVARDKSKDMQMNRYFSHNSPTYGSPFDMMEAYGIDYRAAGENIARGQRTPQEVVNGWMNSEGHRANILNSSFTHIGVGYVENGNYWTQQFIGK